MKFWRSSMDCKALLEHIGYLKDLRKTYIRLHNDPFKSLYSDEMLSDLIDKTNDSIEELLEILAQMDLTDGYNIKTGEIFKLYKVIS